VLARKFYGALEESAKRDSQERTISRNHSGTKAALRQSGEASGVQLRKEQRPSQFFHSDSIPRDSFEIFEKRILQRGCNPKDFIGNYPVR
jgi:hypothetical protein